MRAIFFFSLAWALTASASKLTLRDLERALGKRRQPGWTAASTSLSSLSSRERQRYLGMRADPHFGLGFIESPAPSSRDTLPAVWDWRNIGGVSYASPILNQGFCGACVAFATIGTLETQMNVTRKTPWSPWSLSAQHLFSCGGGTCQSGWLPTEAVSFLQSSGVPDESCFPYQSGVLGENQACSRTCADAKDRSEKITSFETPTTTTVSIGAVKKALLHGPLLSVMQVYDDFFFYRRGVYRHIAGGLAGGHAISILGWNDEHRSWICRNSWGTDWGEGGFFEIAWDDISGVGTSTWSLQVAPFGDYLSLGGLKERAVLAGPVSIPTQSRLSGAPRVEWRLYRGSDLVRTGPLHHGRIELDSNDFSDGTYQIEAVAYASEGLIKSEPRQIAIVNHPPRGRIGFAGLKELSLFSATADLTISTDSSPVPFSEITFTARHLDTGQVFTKRTSNVGPSLMLRWRNGAFPEGVYEVSLSASVGHYPPVQSSKLKVVLAHGTRVTP